ncbi:1,4-alpha-glucan branching protein domain-containing protein, partial [Staphylococcus aureus]|uniref:1,4-alpha-glucan branching protein domain-containing protein n=1 Tax=Staphylococcus aureus TaxID=1280 RepID=UPI00301DCF80
MNLGQPIQTQQPAQSSWGAEGYFKVWLNEGTAWMYPYQHAAEARMAALADAHAATADALTRRALNQAARELLLAQSSDWAFQIYQGTTV